MDFKKTPIRELVDYLLQTNDPAAWAEFQNRISRTVRGGIAKRLRRWKTDELIADLEQETYLKLISRDYKALRTFEWRDDHDCVFKFTKLIATNVVLDFYRDKDNEIFLNPESLDVMTDQRRTGHENADLNLLRDKINKCLHAWSSEKDFERDKAIFWLFYRQGFTAKQIAGLPSINLSEKKVENILQKLVRRVKDQLGKGGKAASSD